MRRFMKCEDEFDSGIKCATTPPAVPYFARRQFINQKMKRLIETGALGCGGTDVTDSISADREDRGG
jgi:hypothetical protein